MANCALTNGHTVGCSDLRAAVGGVKSTIWIGNISELDSVEYDQDGYVTALNFDDYSTQGLHAFTCLRDQNDAGSDGAPTEGGLFSFSHEVVMTLIDVTPAQKTNLEDLAFAGQLAGVFAVVETGGGRFEAYGLDRGLGVESMPARKGQNADAATSRVITLSGTQGTLEKVVFVNDYATTKALIEGYVAS